MYKDESFLPTQMVRLGLSTPEEQREYENKKISFNKLAAQINAEARSKAKKDTCIICKTACTSFCNSHSIPKFSLQKIAEQGIVLSPLQHEIPTLGQSTGIGKAGTFHLICNSCDNSVFQEYENPSAYSTRPSDKMLAQIAMKNYLHMISKRNQEHELYDILGQRYPHYRNVTDEKRFIGDCDLLEYQAGFKYAHKAALAATGSYYYLCCFHLLDYIVPYAAQGTIAMISDFEDGIINDVFDFSPNYQLKNIHIWI